MTDIYLTNTLTRKKEKFKPIKGKKVNLFVCGPTVYDYSHIGHAKTYVQFDILARFLRFSGYDVFYLQNITDIDDKILKRAGELKISWKQLSEKFEKSYLSDMKLLNNTSVTKYARATDYIQQIVKQVQTLIDKGFAYNIPDGVYFEISEFPDYGKLSKRTKLSEYDAVSRIDENKEKRGWNDFCLWKFSKPDEPSWETAIGKGRPGWHIEDTAITETFFGPQYDIHGGAVDLIVPHHEAEIAQMESASGKSPLVKYWLHTGFLKVDGRKMSKSLKNFYTIKDIVDKKYDPLALRYLFLTSHYRDSINFTWDSLSSAQATLKKLYETSRFLRQSKTRSVLSKEKQAKIDKYLREFTEALNDDLNTSKALATMWAALKSNVPSEDKYDLLMYFDEVFGLRINENSTKVEISEEIKNMIDKRNSLRDKGEFEKADKIRVELQKKGYQLDDTLGGARIKKI